MDYTLYWFMFPVSILVATSAMLSGIGGAALFMPIFILVFPLLGPEYPLASPVAAIAVALLTEVFGFSSGFIGYCYKKLIDFRLSKSFLLISVPVAITGALLAHLVNAELVKFAYGILILVIAAIMIRGHTELIADPQQLGNNQRDRNNGAHKLTARNGKTYHYNSCHARLLPTGTGGFLTGMLSVGIGEVVMPQLVKKCGIPVPVAAGTSILIVILTVLSASFTHIITLISEGGINAVPWHLVMYTVPGVIIGGQIGPALQGRIPSELMERNIGILFCIIGIAMIASVI